MAKDIYLSKRLYDEITLLAVKKGVTRSSFVSEILTNVGVGHNDFKPIVLQLPITLLKNNKDGLKDWLDHKIEGIVKLFYSQN